MTTTDNDERGDSELTVQPTKQRYIAADRPRFQLGQILSTPGALKIMTDNDVDPLGLVQRHVRGDWGVVCAADGRANEDAVRYGDRLLSSYLMKSGAVVWIITESDRSVTTLLLPDDY